MLIFQSQHIRVDKVTGFSSRQVLVSFSERREKAQGLDAPGFGQDFARKRALDGFFVKCAGDDWYQYPEMPLAMAAILEGTSTDKEIITYGSSMGAYAAIKFAGQLQAKRVVALSPLFSPDPLKPPYEKRWNSDAKRITFIDDDMGRDISNDAEVFVMTDTTHADAKHARLIAQIIPRTTIVAAPLASHPVGHFLRETEMLTDVISKLIIGDFNNSLWCKVRRASRTKSQIYRDRLNDVLKKRH